jgi:hypothetical protein
MTEGHGLVQDLPSTMADLPSTMALTVQDGLGFGQSGVAKGDRHAISAPTVQGGVKSVLPEVDQKGVAKGGRAKHDLLVECKDKSVRGGLQNSQRPPPLHPNSRPPSTRLLSGTARLTSDKQPPPSTPVATSR